MSVIALQLAERAIEGREPKADHAMFAVFHVADMLKKLKADYEARWFTPAAFSQTRAAGQSQVFHRSSCQV